MVCSTERGKRRRREKPEPTTAGGSASIERCFITPFLFGMSSFIQSIFVVVQGGVSRQLNELDMRQ